MFKILAALTSLFGIAVYSVTEADPSQPASAPLQEPQPLLAAKGPPPAPAGVPNGFRVQLWTNFSDVVDTVASYSGGTSWVSPPVTYTVDHPSLYTPLYSGPIKGLMPIEVSAKSGWFVMKLGTRNAEVNSGLWFQSAPTDFGLVFAPFRGEAQKSVIYTVMITPIP